MKITVFFNSFQQNYLIYSKTGKRAKIWYDITFFWQMSLISTFREDSWGLISASAFMFPYVILVQGDEENPVPHGPVVGKEGTF